MIRIRGLKKSYGKLNALNGVDFNIRRGRITAYLGANGAGKTTTIKIMLGLLRQDSGSVEGDYLRSGYVPDQPRFFAWLTGDRLLQLTAEAYGLPAAQARATFERYARDLRFDPRDLDRKPWIYSRGNAKKMAYLQSLVIEPDFLIADEPFSALDPPSIKAVRDMFREFRDGGGTVFLSSHMLAEMERLADDVVVIRKGEIAGSFSLAGAAVIDLEREFLRLTEN